MIKLLSKPSKKEQNIQKEWKMKPAQKTWRTYIDLGIVVLPVFIGNMKIYDALIYLGESFKIMPMSMVDRIGYLNVKPYARDLQMEDKLRRKLVRVVKDILISVYKHISCIFCGIRYQGRPKNTYYPRKTIHQNCEDARGYE